MDLEEYNFILSTGRKLVGITGEFKDLCIEALKNKTINQQTIFKTKNNKYRIIRIFNKEIVIVRYQ